MLLILGFLTSLSYVLYAVLTIYVLDPDNIPLEAFIYEIIIFRILWPMKDLIVALFLAFFFYWQAKK